MKYTLKIATRNPCQQAPTIRMEWQNRGLENGRVPFGESIINENGVYRQLNYVPSALVDHQKEQRAKIVKFKLPLHTTHGRENFWHAEFSYFDTNEEAERNGMSKIENENNKTLALGFRRHFEVSFKNNEGEETNKNIQSDLLKYNLTDLTERLNKTFDKNVYTLEATSTLYNWYKGDKSKLITFGYIWGAPNIKSDMNIDEIKRLFNYLCTEVVANMKKYESTLKYIDSELHINIIKATRIFDSNKGDYIIKQDNDQYFMFNGSVVGKGENIEYCVDQAVAYFQLHPQDYALLKAELGIVDNLPVINISNEETKENDSIEPKTIKSISKNPHENKEEARLKTKFANLIYRIIVEEKDVLAPKNGNAYALFSQTNNDPELVLKELSEYVEIKDNAALQTFFNQEAERVRKERTPYQYAK